MAINPDILQALRRLNPSLPAEPGDYLDRAWEGMARGWDLPGRLEVLLAADHRVRALMHGPIGVGKTSELNRWARDLREQVEVIPIQVSRAGLLDAWVPLLVWEIHRACSQRLEDLGETPSYELTGRYMSELFPLLHQLERRCGRALLLLVDGLDAMPHTADALAEGSQLALDGLPGVVYVVSHVDLISMPRERRDTRFEHVWSLPAFGVLREDGEIHEPAVAQLTRGLARRLEGLTVFGEPEIALRHAAIYSGGIPRDAIRILRAALLSGAPAGKVNTWHLGQGVAEIRQDLVQTLSSDDITLLKRVRSTGNHEGAWHLISSNAIIAYDGNAQRFWAPHPLLRAVIEPNWSPL